MAEANPVKGKGARPNTVYAECWRRLILGSLNIFTHTELGGSRGEEVEKWSSSIGERLGTYYGKWDDGSDEDNGLQSSLLTLSLSELVTMEGYGDWIRLVAEFTSKSLLSWQWASSSVYYLLGLWSRLVSSVPYLKGDAPSLLDEYVPKITEGFITSRLDSAQAGLPDDISEHPLDNVDLLQDQLDCFPYLADFSAESQEVIDAELSARVLRLVNVADSGLHSQRCGELSKQRLDRAILTFFQNFRKSYVGDQAMHSSKKIARNLKCYTESEEVIDQTLSLFLELASGEHFPFLEEYRCSRSRTTFYYTIGWLIFLEDSAALFKSSMDPLLQVFITLESTPETMFRTDSVKYALIGLMRDLRGIAMATNSRRTYGLLFDWIYPAHMPILLRGISHWADTPEVKKIMQGGRCGFSITLLVVDSRICFEKIYFGDNSIAEIHGRVCVKQSSTIDFDTSSPNGILLFREVSKLLVAYGSRILSLSNATDIYGFKYKGIWISLTILSRALAGNYVNFGVFELYGDRALADALDIALKMTLSIPLADILAYRKLTRAYFAFLEVLFNSHLVFVLSLDTHTFMHIVGSLESGLKGLDAGISSQCASAIDNLAAFYFNNITMGEAPTSVPAANLARHIAECPAVLPEILKTLFEIVLFEDCSNQWSLSRPMLSLILINEQMFTDLKAHILASQPVDQHQRLISCFDKLMSDITRGLDSKNRDKFTQNLTIFRHDFRVK
ncbi:Exportin-7-B [Sesamum angolense]|uniref:Exportin-7-B n=1 Tax=Sesamum angolense TaxID=2727404 RepID=A0AAE2C6J2_9LAMI|nr:Exportin-7-B [Sesamum angolense]